MNRCATQNQTQDQVFQHSVKLCKEASDFPSPETGQAPSLHVFAETRSKHLHLNTYVLREVRKVFTFLIFFRKDSIINLT